MKSVEPTGKKFVHDQKIIKTANEDEVFNINSVASFLMINHSSEIDLQTQHI